MFPMKIFPFLKVMAHSILYHLPSVIQAESSKLVAQRRERMFSRFGGGWLLKVGGDCHTDFYF